MNPKELLVRFLSIMIKEGGSDLHLKAGGYPSMRVHGDIKRISNQLITRELGIEFAKVLAGAKAAEFFQTKDLDTTFIFNPKYRFRVNLFFQKDGITAVLRIIATEILSFEKLNLPKSLLKLTDVKNGIVMVTGATGSGKSTTLAAIIDKINEKHAKHILTVEDPVEFVHKDKKSLVNQRSIGDDTKSFASALKGALREDPDIILIGEMRNIETVEIGLHAAETGHLVFSTLHTTHATETINRVVGMFPPNEQNRIRLALASVIQGVVCQRLPKALDGGRRAALEILLRTPRIVELIRDGRDLEIKQALSEGKEVYGTQNFDDALYDLKMSEQISEEEAISYASSPDNLKLKFKGLNVKNHNAPVVEEETLSLKN